MVLGRGFHRDLFRQLFVIGPVALAIALTTALFTVVDGLLFRPLPFPEPQTLAAITFRQSGRTPDALAYDVRYSATRAAIRARIATSGLVSHQANWVPNTSFTSENGAAELQITDVDRGFFPLLGISPVLGTLFTAEQEAATSNTSPTSRPFVILGHGLWRDQFGSDVNVLGLQHVAGKQVQVVGVMGPEVKFPGETDIWVLIRPLETFPPNIVRLGRDANLSQLASAVPELTVRSLPESLRPGDSSRVIVLFGAAALLTLIAWVQAATLLTAAVTTRLRDIGLRLAMGARREALMARYLVRQSILAGVSVLAAWGASRPLTGILVATLDQDLVHGQYLTPDVRSFQFASLFSIAGFLLVSALPLAVIYRASPLMLINRRIGGVNLEGVTVRRTLLGVQVAVTVLLLYVSGLFAHSLAKAAYFDYGFDSGQVIFFRAPFPRSGSAAVADRDADFEARSAEKKRRAVAMIEALHNVPGVIAAASFFQVPLVAPGNFAGWEDLIFYDTRSFEPAVRIHVNSVSRDFVRTLGATVIEGEDFTTQTSMSGGGAAIVNEAFVRRFAPVLTSGDTELRVGVIGRIVRTRQSTGRIVGVIKDLVYSSVTEPTTPQVFILNADGGTARFIAVRVQGDVDEGTGIVRSRLQQFIDEPAAVRFGLLRNTWEASLRPFVNQSNLVNLVAVLGAILSCVGIASYLTYAVRLRQRDLAIRAALGASARALRQDVLRDVFSVIGWAGIVGIISGVAIGRAIRAQLFLVEPMDLLSILAVALGVVGIALLATLVPAQQAARTQPAVLLRDS